MKRLLQAAAFVLVTYSALWPCSWSIGYFHQVTRLRGKVVGTSRGWPRWIRQSITRDDVTLRLFEYRWPIQKITDMPLVQTVKTGKDGQFDFGQLKRGHYVLVIDWPEDSGNMFEIEITPSLQETRNVTIDVTPVYPDCTGGHEFLSE